MILSTFIKQNDWRDFPVQVGMFFLKYITDRNEHDEHMQELMEYKRAIIRAEEDMNKYPELYDQCLDLFDTYRKKHRHECHCCISTVVRSLLCCKG